MMARLAGLGSKQGCADAEVALSIHLDVGWCRGNRRELAPIQDMLLVDQRG